MCLWITNKGDPKYSHKGLLMKFFQMLVRFTTHNLSTFQNEYAVQFLSQDLQSVEFEYTLVHELDSNLFCIVESFCLDEKNPSKLALKLLKHLDTTCLEIVRRFDQALFEGIRQGVENPCFTVVVCQEMALFKLFSVESRSIQYHTNEYSFDVNKSYLHSVVDALAQAKYEWYAKNHIGVHCNVDEAKRNFKVPTHLQGSVLIDTESDKKLYQVYFATHDLADSIKDNHNKNLFSYEVVDSFFSEDPNTLAQAIGNLEAKFLTAFSSVDCELYINVSGCFTNIEIMVEHFKKQIQRII